jgi:hypothetical protein
LDKIDVYYIFYKDRTYNTMGKHLSSTKRKDLNNERAAKAASGSEPGILFGRVVKLMGNGQVHVMIDGKSKGVKTLLVRLPRILQSRGATPLTNASVVSIFVGEEFDPDTDLKAGEGIISDYHFDITAIIDEKIAHKLVKEKVIPDWMVKSDVGAKEDIRTDEGYTFEVEEEPVEAGEEEGETSSNSAAATAPARRGASGREKAKPSESRLVHVSGDPDIDAI